MGRAFEYRKARKLKRWGNMARTFTKLGKEIEIAVKAAGPDPGGNTRLRVLIQNAKAANMPKENVERAIKRAVSKDTADYKEMVYEGYAPFGIAMIIETATDNSTRTVANVRSYFNKAGGSLGTTGSVDFMFDHKCVFKITKVEGIDLDELEQDRLEAIRSLINNDPNTLGEDHNYELISGEFERIPLDTKEVTDEQRASIEKLIEKFEEDDDVTNVFHNMKESETDDAE